MRTYTTKHTVYNFDELSDEAKQKALDRYREKHNKSLYEDNAWSTQNDDYWTMELEDYGLTYGGYDKTYFDTYRGGSGFGGLDIDNYAKLAGALKLDKRSKAYKLIANEDIHFNLETGRDYNDIRSVEFEEYGLTSEEFEELPDKVQKELEKICDKIVDVVQALESKLLASARSNEEYYFPDEGLKEMFESNEFEFYKDGSIA